MKQLFIIYLSSRTIQFFIGSLYKEFSMGDKDKSKISNSEMENLSLDTSRHPRDFLTRFSGWREGEFGAIKEEGCDDDEEEEIELNLGLSLGGRLGVDKGSMKLIRSSSIAECLPIVKDEDDALTSSSPPAVAYSRLVRTTSLPLGSDEELRKRKELQTLRRMEAKKRRSEKQRNLKGEREEGGGSQLQEEKRETIDLNLRSRLEKDRVFEAAKRSNSWVAPPFNSTSWAADVSRETVPQGGGGGGGGGGGVAKGKGMQEFVESHGGSSSEMDNRSLPRTGSCGNTSPGNIQSSMQESSNQDVGSSSSGTKTRRDQNLGRTSSLDVEHPSKQSDTTRSNLQPRETRANALEDMPCVFTKGDGPNGRRVDGILYKYGRGEEVRIMCVCHGSFHSPAEFVKHAGGTDITHPLKHIVVNPNTTPFT